MTRLVALTMSVALWVVGCAATPPLVPVRNADERLRFNGFSVLPPGGADWFWVGREHQDRSRLFETTFVKKDGPRTCGAHAELLDTRGQRYGGPADILALLKSQQRFQEHPRQRNLKVDFTIDDALGIPCVRFDAVAEDPEAPAYPGLILELDFHGYACIHPSTPGVVAEISYSGRTPKGSPHVVQPDEGERFLRSLQFTPVRP